MISGFFGKPNTRFYQTSELKNIAIFLKGLEDKELELREAAKNKGADEPDYRKHTVVKTLLDELKKLEASFNKAKKPNTPKQQKQELINLIQEMYKNINTSLTLFNDTLMAPRNHYKENLNGGIKLTSGMLALASAIYVPVIASLFAFFYLAPKVSDTIRAWLGINTDETATVTLLKAFTKCLIEAGDNLGLAKHWQLKHGNPNDLDIETEITCPINRTIMIEPVTCLLDNNTYEKSAIQQWLNLRRTSPMDPSKKIPEGKTVDDVLSLNRNIKNIIEILKKTHPEYFDGQSEKPRMRCKA